MRKTNIPHRLMRFFSLLLVAMLCIPTVAFGLTTNSTTARSNETGSGNAVLGGIPTRITWEGAVGADEQITAMHIDFPNGCDLDEAYLKVTALEGLDRLEVVSDSSFSDKALDVTFTTPIPSGTTLRLEMQAVSLPAHGGDVVLTGTYTDQQGQTSSLQDSPAISVVQVTTTERIVGALDNAEWCQAWNSNKFLGTFLKPQLIVSSIPSLFFGWLRALMLVFIGFPLAIPIGLGFSFMKISHSRVLHFIAAIYVNVIRGTPLFLQIYIAFFGLPLMGIQINNYVLGVCVLAINSSAYLCEIFRAGIQSIPKGQFEAAWSLGMSKSQTMFNVIIPQTVRRVIPTMTSEFILLYKDSSLLSAVGVMELMMFAKSITANTGNITPYIVAAGYYLIVTLPLIRLVNMVEQRVARGDGSASSDAGDSRKRRRAKRSAGQEAKQATMAVRTEAAQAGLVTSDGRAGSTGGTGQGAGIPADGPMRGGSHALS